MANASAAFDFLFITERLSAKLGTATFGEVHLFAYLSCLLSLFRRQPVAEWGYNFAGLDQGAPFSPELHAAYSDLESAGLVASKGEAFILTPEGKQELESLSDLQQLEFRRPCLEAACDSLLSFPVGMVRNAMSMEPGLRPALRVGGTRPLLDAGAIAQLHEHFDALYTVLGQTHDLLVPSTVWLTYLLELSRKYDQDLARVQGSR
jgi:hypothetical protein